MSPDGRYVALVSARTKFTLPALQFQGSPRTVPGTRELYVADLQQKTIERVTHSTSGGDIDGDVLNGVTISGNGDRVAFASFAGNLFYGDANGRSDAFVATRQPEPGGGPTGEGGGGGGPGGTVEFDSGGPQIGVRAASKRGGVVVLAVSVPAAGGVRAVAKGQAGDPRKLRTLATADGACPRQQPQHRDPEAQAGRSLPRRAPPRGGDLRPVPRSPTSPHRAGDGPARRSTSRSGRPWRRPPGERKSEPPVSHW